jgi:hypothetical protein
MNSAKDIVLLVVISLGVAILALLYSPIGSPQLYNFETASIHKSVQFDGHITNSPRHTWTNIDYTNPFEGIQIKPSPINNTTPNYAVISTNDKQTSNYTVNLSNSIEEPISKNSGGMGSDGVFFSLSSMKKQNKQDPNLMAFSYDLPSKKSNPFSFEPKNKAPYAANEGGMDPGADPTSEPLPLDNEVGILILFLSLYFLFKKYKQQLS